MDCSVDVLKKKSEESLGNFYLSLLKNDNSISNFARCLNALNSFNSNSLDLFKVLSAKDEKNNSNLLGIIIVGFAKGGVYANYNNLSAYFSFFNKLTSEEKTKILSHSNSNNDDITRLLVNKAYKLEKKFFKEFFHLLKGDFDSVFKKSLSNEDFIFTEFFLNDIKKRGFFDKLQCEEEFLCKARNIVSEVLLENLRTFPWLAFSKKAKLSLAEDLFPFFIENKLQNNIYENNALSACHLMASYGVQKNEGCNYSKEVHFKSTDVSVLLQPENARIPHKGNMLIITGTHLEKNDVIFGFEHILYTNGFNVCALHTMNSKCNDNVESDLIKKISLCGFRDFKIVITATHGLYIDSVKDVALQIYSNKGGAERVCDSRETHKQYGITSNDLYHLLENFVDADYVEFFMPSCRGHTSITKGIADRSFIDRNFSLLVTSSYVYKSVDNIDFCRNKGETNCDTLSKNISNDRLIFCDTSSKNISNCARILHEVGVNHSIPFLYNILIDYLYGLHHYSESEDSTKCLPLPTYYKLSPKINIPESFFKISPAASCVIEKKECNLETVDVRLVDSYNFIKNNKTDHLYVDRIHNFKHRYVEEICCTAGGHTKDAFSNCVDVLNNCIDGDCLAANLLFESQNNITAFSISGLIEVTDHFFHLHPGNESCQFEIDNSKIL